MTYAFRLVFRTSDDSFPANSPEQTLTLVDVPPITVRTSPKDSGRKNEVTLLARGFESIEQARAIGETLKRAVMLAGVLLHAGIDVGTNQVVSEPAKSAGGLADPRFQPDVHGLHVFPEMDHQMFGFLRWGPRERKPYPLSEFERKVAESWQAATVLTKKHELAVQLFSQSRFQSSQLATLLMLISAVESVAEPEERSGPAAEFLSQICKQAETLGLDTQDRSLLSALEHLKRESISAACRRLVRRYCGDDDSDAFAGAYVVRSKILHSGHTPPEQQLDAINFKLDGIVRSLLVRHVSDSLKGLLPSQRSSLRGSPSKSKESEEKS
jgi:hypothetical protein